MIAHALFQLILPLLPYIIPVVIIFILLIFAAMAILDIFTPENNKENNNMNVATTEDIFYDFLRILENGAVYDYYKRNR